MLNWLGMVYQKRGSAPTNTIKLTLDYRTLDRLRDLAKARKVDPTRCAYELLQECLGLIEPPAPQPGSTGPEIEDRMGQLVARISQTHKPQESQ